MDLQFCEFEESLDLIHVTCSEFSSATADAPPRVLPASGGGREPLRLQRDGHHDKLLSLEYSFLHRSGA